MTRDEVIRLAILADPGFDGGPDADGTMPDSLVGIKSIERFAELVAAEYKRDAERYRKLIALLQEAYDGNVIELENRFIVDCAMLGWADTRDEPLNLDAAIDAEMEKQP